MSDQCTPCQSTYPSDCEVLEGYRERARQKMEQKNDPHRQRALARARDIRLLLLDVDGVLTDGTLLYTGADQESKSFHTQDGFGLRLLGEAGIDVGIITARESAVVKRRAEELKMNYIYQGVPNKNKAFKDILIKTGYKPIEIAYMGDDWLDLVLLQQVGLAAAPANAVAEVQETAHFIAGKNGGEGAVRQLCNLLLEAKGLTEKLLQKYRNR